MIIGGASGLLGVATLYFLWPYGESQINPVSYYSTPNYCTSVVASSTPACPSSFCYAADTRDQCCMGVFRSANGNSLYQQCLCSTLVSCSSQNTTGNTNIRPSNPICCAGFLPKICSSLDPCLTPPTLSLCCLKIEKLVISGLPTVLNVTCSCNQQVSC